MTLTSPPAMGPISARATITAMAMRVSTRRKAILLVNLGDFVSLAGPSGVPTSETARFCVFTGRLSSSTITPV
jgi:hypothetical protein